MDIETANFDLQELITLYDSLCEGQITTAIIALSSTLHNFVKLIE